MNITQEMVDQATREEDTILAQSPEVLRVTNEHLRNRVVMLRALVNEQKARLDEHELLASERSEAEPVDQD